MVNRAYPLADDTRAQFHFTSGNIVAAPGGTSPETEVYDAQAVHRGHPHQQARYSLAPSAGDNHLFSIDPTTGAVTFKATPDYEHPTDANHDNVYDVVVTARFGPLRISHLVEIKVTDGAPAAPVDANPSPNVVTEGASAGTSVGLTAASTDIDGSAVTYSLTADSSDGGFGINPSTGVVTVADPSKIDHVPNGGSFDVTVQAADPSGASSAQTFQIAVDGGSTFFYGPVPVVAKGHSASETPSVSSPEGGDHFAFATSGQGTYGTATVNAATGVVTYAASSAPAAGATATDSFTVVDIDGYGAKTSATAPFTVDGGSAISYGSAPVVAQGGSASETPSVTSPEGGDRFAFATSGQGTYGTATINAATGVVAYTASSAPAAGTTATDSFTVVDTDADGARTTASASFTVDGGSSLAYGPTAIVAKGYSASEMPSVSSPEGGDHFAFASGGTSTTGTDGTATVDASTGAVTYTATSAPDAGATAAESFKVVDTDAYGARTNAVASFNVDGGTAFSYRTANAVAKSGSASATPSVSSPEGGDHFAFASGGTAATGMYGKATVDASTGAVTYTATSAPDAGATATEKLTVVDTDAYGARTNAVASFIVDGGAAFSYPTENAVPKGASASATPSVTSPEGGDRFAFAAGASGGTGQYGTATLDATTGTVSYTASSAPAAGTTAMDSFTIVDTDVDGARTQATATFTVNGADKWIATSGSWTDGPNWSEGHAPTAEPALIPSGSSPYVFNTGASVVVDDVALSNAATITITPGATFLLEDGTTVTGGALTIGASSGILEIEKGGGAPVQQGATAYGATLDGVTVTNGATVSVAASATLTLDDDTSITGGMLTVAASSGILDIEVGGASGASGATLESVAVASYGTVAVAAGATLTLSNSTLDGTAGSLSNAGTIQIQGSSKLELASSVTGTGKIVIGRGASLEVTAQENQTIVFAAATGTLQIDQPAAFTADVSAANGNVLQTGDVFDFSSLNYSTTTATTGAGSYDATMNTTTLTVADSTTSSTYRITLVGNYSGSTFTVSNDGNGGADIADPPAASNSRGHAVAVDSGAHHATLPDPASAFDSSNVVSAASQRATDYTRFVFAPHHGPGHADHFVFDTMPLSNEPAHHGTGIAGHGVAHDVLDVSAIVAQLHASGLPPHALFEAVENAAGTAAALKVNEGTAAAPHWVAIAHLDGLHPGDGVALSYDAAHPTHVAHIPVEAHALASHLG